MLHGQKNNKLRSKVCLDRETMIMYVLWKSGSQNNTNLTEEFKISGFQRAPTCWHECR